MAMRRFTFTTSSTPKYSGEGVTWGDGRATYRLKVGTTDAYHPPYTGQVSDITLQYGGLPGYTFSYTDS